MNIKEVEILLKQYYAGKTTLDEDQELKDFFNGDDVPEPLLAHKPLFLFLQEEKEVKLIRTDFDQRMDKTLSNSSPVAPARFSLVDWYPAIAVAASVLLIAVMFFVFQNDHNPSKNQLTAWAGTSQEIAFDETKYLLEMVSAELNTGISKIEKLNILDNALNDINKLQKFYYYQNQIINPDVIIHPSENNQ